MAEDETQPLEKPNISSVIQNFLDFQYGNESEENQEQAMKICKRILKEINNKEPPMPSASDPAEYKTLYNQFIQLRQERGQLKIIEIFGVSLLKILLKTVRDDILQTQLFVGFDAKALFEKLQKEIYNPKSVILKEDYEEGSATTSALPSAASAVPSTAVASQPTPFDAALSNHKKRGREAANGSEEDDVSQSKKKKRRLRKNEIIEDEEDVMDEAEEEEAEDEDEEEDAGDRGDEMNGDDGSFGAKQPLEMMGDKTTVSMTGGSIVTTKITTEKEDLLGPDVVSQSMSRDEIAKREEDHGSLMFKVVKNDGAMKSLEMLLALKNIFGRQLPKMPKDYICRLVFDKNHQSMVGFKSGRVVGGITFRPFFTQGFGEIAFCAITGNEQVRGYGTRLMNNLKNYAQSIDIFRFLTYADNFAIGYFKKQGFTKEITLEERKYRGFIKDYDGGTLMECCIRPGINYLDVPGMVKIQREAVYEKMKEISNSHVVQPGLVRSKKIAIEDVPGLREANFKPRSKEELDSLTMALKKVLDNIDNHEVSWPFKEPVDPSAVPDYYEIIKEPMDLLTMRQRLKQGFYRNPDIFIADFRKIVENCKTYNKEDTEYYECAVLLEKYFKEQMRSCVK